MTDNPYRKNEYTEEDKPSIVNKILKYIEQHKFKMEWSGQNGQDCLYADLDEEHIIQLIPNWLFPSEIKFGIIPYFLYKIIFFALSVFDE